MESDKLRSQLKSNHNPNQAMALTSANSADPRRVKLCAERLTPECRLAGGRLDPDRARRGNSRYCPACAYRLKLNRNAANKRRKRREMGSRSYSDEYSPFLTDEERKAFHRRYMRAYRGFQNHWRESNLSLDEKQKRAYRCDFIKAVLASPAGQRRPSATRSEINQSEVSCPAVKARVVASVAGSRSGSKSGQSMNGGAIK